MHSVDRLFRFLSVTALWLIAAMVYVAFFHEGGQFKLSSSSPQAEVKVAFPDKLAVVNADGSPLKIVGEVTMAKPSQTAPKVRLNCKLTGSITTAQPSFRIFSGEWKPDRDWPVSAKLECETQEPVQ
jgi:hypothetical protein